MNSSRIKRLATGAREELMREVAGRLSAALAPDSPERLSDGVRVNYNKFPHALAKVQGLSDWK